MTRFFAVVAFCATFCAMAAVSHAVEPGEMLKDPALEARARDISKGLRCVVCQNENIDESNADLAKDLRILVRRRLTVGDSNAEVVQYIVDRYGDYVLLEPPLKSSTYVLWYGPFVLFALVIGGAAVFFIRKVRKSRAAPRQNPQAANPAAAAGTLTAAEEQRLAELLDPPSSDNA